MRSLCLLPTLFALALLGCDGPAVTASGPAVTTVPEPMPSVEVRPIEGWAAWAPSLPDHATVVRLVADRCDVCGGLGAVRGRVCAPSAQAFVGGATVTLRGQGCDGAEWQAETTADAHGDWRVDDVPCGVQAVTTEKGSFASESVVTVVGGQLSDTRGASEKQCFQASATRIAVLGGEWDDLETLVADLGLDFDFFSEGSGEPTDETIVGLLSDPVRLAGYDIVFAGCGHAVGRMAIDHPEVMANVREFVLGGGSLYLSDYAWTLGESAFPKAVEWANSDDPTTMGRLDVSPQQIPSGLTVMATVADPDLAAYLGKGKLPITFEEGPQIAPVSVAAGGTAHVVADLVTPSLAIRAAPIALSYVPAPGAGRVVYTNFHNDAQATGDILGVIRYLVFML